MLKILLALLLTAAPSFGAYGFSRTVTINHLKVPNTDQTNFTFPVNGTYSYLATVANGGKIQNTVSFNGQTVPADLKFTSDVGGTSLLSWDVASYTATTGVIEIWVKVASISHTVDTVIYMFYGDASVTTYQGGSLGAAYDASTIAIYHLANGSSLSVADSSVNALTLTGSGGPTATTGQVDGGVALASASSQYLFLVNANIMNTLSRTTSVWVKATSFPGAYNTVLSLGTTSSTVDAFDLHVKSNGKLAMYVDTVGPTLVFYDGTGTNTLSTGVWYHLVMSYGSAEGLTGYVNGAVDGTAAGAGNIITDPNPEFNIGNNQPNFGTRLFNGAVDVARVDTGIRSADWATTTYNSQFSPSTFYTIGSEVGGGATRIRVIAQ